MLSSVASLSISQSSTINATPEITNKLKLSKVIEARLQNDYKYLISMDKHNLHI